MDEENSCQKQPESSSVDSKRNYFELKEAYFSSFFDFWVKQNVTKKEYIIDETKQKFSSANHSFKIIIAETQEIRIIQNDSSKEGVFKLSIVKDTEEELSVLEKVLRFMDEKFQYFMDQEIQAETKGEEGYVIRNSFYAHLNDKDDEFLKLFVEELAKRGYSHVEYDEDRDIMIRL